MGTLRARGCPRQRSPTLCDCEGGWSWCLPASCPPQTLLCHGRGERGSDDGLGTGASACLSPAGQRLAAESPSQPLSCGHGLLSRARQSRGQQVRADRGARALEQLLECPCRAVIVQAPWSLRGATVSPGRAPGHVSIARRRPGACCQPSGRGGYVFIRWTAPGRPLQAGADRSRDSWESILAPQSWPSSGVRQRKQPWSGVWCHEIRGPGLRFCRSRADGSPSQPGRSRAASPRPGGSWRAVSQPAVTGLTDGQPGGQGLTGEGPDRPREASEVSGEE